METQRKQVVQRLSELNAIRFIMPSARELHSKRPGLARVQRKEMERYKMNVQKQKGMLIKKLGVIDNYLKGKQEYQNYLSRKSAFVKREDVRLNQARIQMNKVKSNNLRKGPKRMSSNGNNSNVLVRRTFQEVRPMLISRPNIVLGRRPMLRKTRLVRMRRQRMVR